METMMNQPDWTLPIDAKDAPGNTLLSIACQNNNKRIAKLCLRRGADINTQNVRSFRYFVRFVWHFVTNERL